MRQSKFNGVQIALVQEQVWHFTTVGETCRELGLSSAIFYARR